MGLAILADSIFVTLVKGRYTWMYFQVHLSFRKLIGFVRRTHNTKHIIITSIIIIITIKFAYSSQLMGAQVLVAEWLDG